MEIKRPTTIEEQIKILGGRKLVIEDVEFAQNVLLSVNYYNFTGYLHTYKNADDNYENISFNQAYRIYPVSYTHLDVYKRQVLDRCEKELH